MATLQEQYNSINNGSGNKDQFLKQARSLFPQYFNQYTDFDTATNVLKQKLIISEALSGVVAKGFDIWDWKKILAEESKAEEKETPKEVKDANKNASQPSDMKNSDNVNFNEIMKGFYAEMRDDKNSKKTGDEIKAMVVKNLAKDPLFYTKDGMFGERGVGFTTEVPGLGTPKEAKGKHKASGYGDVKEGKIKEGNLGHNETWSLEPEGRFWILTYSTMNGKKEKTFDSEDEAKKWIKQNLDEAMDQGPVSIKGKTGPTGGTQKIPRALFLDKEVINTINNVQPGSVKLISKPGDKRVYMYVSSFVKNALDELERGRSSREKLKKQSKLADVLADKLPSAIRGKIKKEINPKMDSGLKMHYVDLNISPKKDKTGYWVLAKGESAPLVTEQKLRSLVRDIINEELNEISPDLFKRATDVARGRGQDQRVSNMGETFFNKFRNKPLMGGNIVNVGYSKPQQSNYEEVVVEIEIPSEEDPQKPKKRFIYYDVISDEWNINTEVTRADARIFSLIAQHINPNTKYKSGGEGFKIQGY